MNPIFEAFFKGKRMMWTSSPECVPDKRTQNQMKEAGYEVIIRKAVKKNVVGQ